MDDDLRDDPFADPEDEAAAERERRRQEREERRRREGREPVFPESASTEFGPARLAERLEQWEREEGAAEQGLQDAEPEGEQPDRSRAAGSWGPGAREPLFPGRPPSGGRRPRHSSLVRGFLALTLAACVLLVGWFVVSVAQPFHGGGGDRVNLEVPEGASVSEIADLLSDHGVIAGSTMFEIRVTLAGKRSEMYPGTYSLREDMSYGDAIEALSTVPVERTVTITIPEGMSRAEIAELVRDAGLPGDYMRASRASDLLDPTRFGGPPRAGLEGFLFPATYELPAESGAAALVNHQLRAFRDRLAGIDLRYAQASNLTVFDVVTIASMVEREIAEPRERPIAASVIYNRLREGMPLQIDATTRFAVGNFDSPLTESELASDSPYNTRIHSGLPPGPIGNPGEESLRAASRPADTNYLYYVIEPGTCNLHSFSETFAEFERDVAEYHRAREEAGGRSPTECP